MLPNFLLLQASATSQATNPLVGFLPILLIFGIIGTITEMKEDDTLVLRVKPDGIKLQVARSAISSLVQGEVAKK